MKLFPENQHRRNGKNQQCKEGFGRKKRGGVLNPRKGEDRLRNGNSSRRDQPDHRRVQTVHCGGDQLAAAKPQKALCNQKDNQKRRENDAERGAYRAEKAGGLRADISGDIDGNMFLILSGFFMSAFIKFTFYD